MSEHPSPPTGKRVGLRRGITVTQAAIEAGHVPTIEHVGKRFRITCPCGWSTQANFTRKKAFDEVGLHMLVAGRTALGHDPAQGKIPPVNRSA